MTESARYNGVRNPSHECDQHCDHGGQTVALLAFLAMPVAAVVLVIVMALR